MRAPTVLVVAIAALAFATSTAGAALTPGSRGVTSDPCASAPTDASTKPSTCTTFTGKTPPKLIIHESEFSRDGGTLAEEAQLEAAIGDVVDQFNAIGGTSAKIASVTHTTAPFNYDTLY